MKIIIVNQSRPDAHAFCLSNWLLVCCLLCVVTFCFSTGIFFASYIADSQSVVSLSKDEIVNWRSAIEKQGQDISSVKVSTDRELSAIAVQVARLHGRLLRLDALGERIIAIANLDSDEFDFSIPAAQGGEEANEYGSHEIPAFMRTLDDVAIRVGRREQQLEVLEGFLLDKKIRKDVFIEGRPLAKGWISSEFGYRTDPFTGRIVWHKGIDFAGKEGSKVFSVGAGVVTWSGERGGYGELVEISHGKGFVTRYAHNRNTLVKRGQIVEKGQEIACIGNTGRSTGPHVHFEVIKDGRNVNPAHFVR